MKTSIDFKTYLKNRWNQIYTSPDAKFIFTGEVESIKARKDGEIYLLLNDARKNKNVHSLNPTKVEVFKPFDPTKFNFNKGTEKQLLFYVNFDSEEVVTREAAIKESEKFLDRDPEEGQQESENHPVFLNAFPLCRNHSLLVVFPEQQLPQVIGQDVMLLILNIFKLSPDLIMGYNSLCAAASVNHLHVHMLYSEDLINAEVSALPIHKFKRKLLHKTSLVNPKEQLNMFSVGVVIQQLTGEAHGFVLSPLDKKAESASIGSSLSYVFGLIINELLQANIPHNVLMLDGGNSIYIFPRKFTPGSDGIGWLELAGVYVCHDEQSYKNMSEGVIKKKISELQLDSLEPIKKKFLKRLEQYS